MIALVVTSASSFLGRALLASLSDGRRSELRLLIHHWRPGQRPAEMSTPLEAFVKALCTWDQAATRYVALFQQLAGTLYIPCAS